MGPKMKITTTQRQNPGKLRPISKTNRKIKKNLKKQLGELSNEELAEMENFIGLLKEQEEEQKFIERLEVERKLQEGLNFDELKI
jgi:hypothetical protein